MALLTTSKTEGEGQLISNKARALREAAKAKNIEKGGSIGTGVGSAAGGLAAIIATALTLGAAAPLIAPAIAVGGMAGGAIGKVASGGTLGTDPQDVVTAGRQTNQLYDAFKKAKGLGLADMTKETLAKYVTDHPDVITSDEYLNLGNTLGDAFFGISTLGGG